MLARLRIGLLAFVVLIAVAVPGWSLNADGGACQLTVNIAFGGTGMKSVAMALSSPSYSMTVTAGDIAPTVAGNQNCIYDFGGLPSPYRSTTIGTIPISTSDDLWACEAVAAFGTWNQDFSPSPPSSWSSLNYTMTGTWGDWTLVIDGPGQFGIYYIVIPLTFASPGDASQLAGKCQGNITTPGVTSLSLTGVELLMDPSAP